MAKLGVVDIALELQQEMSDPSKHKQQFNMEAMQKVVDHMNLKLCEGAKFSQVNAMALALMVNTHTMDGNQSLHSVTSMQVELDLGRAREEFHMWLCIFGSLPQITPYLRSHPSPMRQWMTWSPLALGDLRKCTASTRRPEITASVSESV
jgi:hypothetical protein